LLCVTKSQDSRSAADGPSLERSVGLTDAVVAIAMTLLILPVVEIAGDLDTGHLRASLLEHRDVLISFAVSFLVIYIFWAAHGTAFRRLEGRGVEVRALRPLNMCWLLVIAFLPFPTALVGRDLTTTTAPLYLGSMLVLSALTSAIIVVVDGAVGRSRRASWAWITTAVFALCTLLSLVNVDLGMFTLLLLGVIRVVEARILSRTAL
jgi:uncharacterized membrane protein